MNIRNTKGFTLLEIIIVIIIVGVLASLALPRFFSTVEFSRSTEALNALGVIRKSIARCAMVNNNSFGCDNFGNVDIDDPGSEPGAHFSYAWVNSPPSTYTITATRNATNGGDGSSTVVLAVSPTGQVRSGTTSFSSIK